MLLINNLYGEYDANTAEGRGANAAANLVKYFIAGKQVLQENAQKLMKGEITMQEACRNKPLEDFSRAYIPYTEIDEETREINLKYAMAFATVYINTLDNDNDGALTLDEIGEIGYIIDQVDPSGKITKAKFLCWLVFQDCVGVLNGVITPQEAARALIWAKNDPNFVIKKLKEIYKKLRLKEKEELFSVPEPVKN